MDGVAWVVVRCRFVSSVDFHRPHSLSFRLDVISRIASALSQLWLKVHRSRRHPLIGAPKEVFNFLVNGIADGLFRSYNWTKWNTIGVEPDYLRAPRSIAIYPTHTKSNSKGSSVSRDEKEELWLLLSEIL